VNSRLVGLISLGRQALQLHINNLLHPNASQVNEEAIVTMLIAYPGHRGLLPRSEADFKEVIIDGGT